MLEMWQKIIEVPLNKEQIEIILEYGCPSDEVEAELKLALANVEKYVLKCRQEEIVDINCAFTGECDGFDLPEDIHNKICDVYEYLEDFEDM